MSQEPGGGCSNRTPIHKLNGTLGLDCGHSSVDILENDVSTVHEAASHVLCVTAPIHV